MQEQGREKISLLNTRSGVGTSGIQLVSLLNNTQVFITAGSFEKIDYCKNLGAKGGANYKEGPWLPQILEASEGGVNVVLDCVGQNYFSDNLQVLRDEGKPCMEIFLRLREVGNDRLAQWIYFTCWS